MNDGYFIILDKLTATLDGRIGDWKDEYEGLSERLLVSTPLPLVSTPLPPNVPPPECNLIEHLAKRLKVAYSIASALEYLHSRHVVFRDLKPANVGFDCNDCVKMFDFGFATSIAPLLNEQIRSGKEQQGYGPLTETCGTRRYMAPEVGEFDFFSCCVHSSIFWCKKLTVSFFPCHL
jgi:serine/threonine protein kinase